MAYVKTIIWYTLYQYQHVFARSPATDKAESSNNILNNGSDILIPKKLNSIYKHFSTIPFILLITLIMILKFTRITSIGSKTLGTDKEKDNLQMNRSIHGIRYTEKTTKRKNKGTKKHGDKGYQKKKDKKTDYSKKRKKENTHSPNREINIARDILMHDKFRFENLKNHHKKQNVISTSYSPTLQSEYSQDDSVILKHGVRRIMDICTNLPKDENNIHLYNQKGVIANPQPLISKLPNISKSLQNVFQPNHSMEANMNDSINSRKSILENMSFDRRLLYDNLGDNKVKSFRLPIKNNRDKDSQNTHSLESSNRIKF